MKQNSRLNGVTAKVYAGLSPRSRIKHLIALTVAGKTADADRLLRGAPRGTYKVLEPELMARLRALLALSREIGRTISDTRNQLAFLEWQRAELKRREFISSLLRREPQELLAEEGLDPRWKTLRAMRIRGTHEEALCEHVDALVFNIFYAPVLAVAKLRWRAFDAVCREQFDVDGKTFIRAYCTQEDVEWVDWLEKELARLELDVDEEHEKVPFENARQSLTQLFLHTKNMEKKDA